MAEPFELLYVDWITKVPTIAIGETTIIVCTDALTKWRDAKAYLLATLLASAQFLSEHFVFRFGTPTTVATSNGSHFEGHFWDFLEKLHVKHLFGSPHHPQSQGHMERSNGMIINRLRKWMVHRPQSWDTFLPIAILTLNNRWSERLKISPLHALIGRQPKNSLQALAAQMSSEDYSKVYKLVEATLQLDDRLELLVGLRNEVQRVPAAANAGMIRKYNKGLRPKKFRVGGVVLMKTCATQKKGQKLIPAWVGLGVIAWVSDRGAAKVETLTGGTKTYNLDSLKHYFGRIEGTD